MAALRACLFLPSNHPAFPSLLVFACLSTCFCLPTWLPGFESLSPFASLLSLPCLSPVFFCLPVYLLFRSSLPPPFAYLPACFCLPGYALLPACFFLPDYLCAFASLHAF
jgi:hypothetical protein